MFVDPSVSVTSVPRTRASSATPTATPPGPPSASGAGGVDRKPSLPSHLSTDLLARQEIFNRISTSSVK